MIADALDADRAARRSAQTVFDRPVVLEAGAGTGKTTALVGRLLAWTLGAGWEATSADQPDDERRAAALLEGIVAITFTEAAAAEMAARAQRELSEIASGGALPVWLEPDAVPVAADVRARRARALLAAVDRLRVQTIHSFAFALLRSHGLELDLHPAIEVDADESVLRQTVIDVVGERLPALYRDGDPALARLARAEIGPGKIHEALIELARRGVGAAALEADPWTEGAIGSLLETARAATRDVAAAVAGARFDGRATNSRALAESAAGFAEALVAAPPTRASLAELAARLDELLPQGARARLADWARDSLNGTEEKQIAGRAEAVDAARRLRAPLRLLEQLDAERLDAARAVLAPLALEVERRMRARGRATFADLLRLAVELVAKPRVAREIRCAIRQLLVDELQDTDELQCELIARLALDGPAAERPGLFLVGDPKQSIYGWRRARLANYFAFVERALAGDSAGQLAANFRSVAGVLAEVERSVSPVMAEQTEVAAPFAPLLATGERAEAAGEVEFWIASEDEQGAPLSAGERARREAAAVADDLSRRLAAGELEPQDAAILLRAGSQAERFLDALRDRGVPFAVEKDRSYFRRRETLDAAALVRAVLDPADRAALVAWLRSPWVGVPDAALLPLFRERLPELLAEAIAPEPAAIEGLDAAVARAAAATPAGDPQLDELAGWPQALSAAVADLLERRAAWATESAAVWIQGLRRLFQPELVAAARYQGRYRLANLDRFFRELNERLEALEPIHWLLSDLRAAARERPDEPESRPLDGAGNAVRVMTVHAAKGLEFDTVYVVSAHHRPSGRSGAPLVEAERIDGRWELRLFGAPGPGFAPAADLAERIRAAEQVRLLYVALTRPRRRLVVSGALAPAKRPVAPETSRSLADLLAHRVPLGGIEWLREEGRDERRDEHGVRWRRIGAPSAADSIPEPAADDIVAPFSPEESLARLVPMRAAARERAERGRAAAASDLAELEAEPLEIGGDEPALDDRERRRVRARGSALHRALELAPIAATAPERWRAAARSALELMLPDAGDDDLHDLDGDLDALLSSRLFARLEELAPRVRARELPLVLRSDSASPAAPLEAITGTIDLVYEDVSERLVVADFKSDAVANDAEVEAILHRYRPQLALYGRAVGDALGLDEPPRLELWLLALDRVVEVPPAGAAGDSG